MNRTSKTLEEKIIDIWVKPRSSRNEILGQRDGYWVIRVTGAPVEGEANRLCCQVLAEVLGIPPSKVEIVSGHKGRRKRVRVKEIGPANWSRLVKQEGLRS